GRWRDGWGRRIRIGSATDILGRTRRTLVVLAAAHRDHDTANNAAANLAAFCQRCHMIQDRPEHQRRRWRTLFRRKSLGDLFGGPYAKKPAPTVLCCHCYDEVRVFVGDYGRGYSPDQTQAF
ncbi:hypothetical protein MKL01_00120, partial [Methylobacterium sp. J-070]|nr:hypothetical protein [Methylobacterium sp. J-070]